MRTLEDLKYGLRILSKSKGFTLIAVLTLALGIGSSTAVFSIVNAILLKPLPYPHAERIVLPWRLAPQGLDIGYDKIPWGLTAIRFFWSGSKDFEQLGAFESDAFNLSGAGEPAHLQGVRASAAFFQVLGIPPMLGRIFSADEDQPGREHEVVLGYAVWRDRFASEPAIVGRSINLNSSVYTVVGVMPPGFMFPRAEEMPGSFSFARETQLWVPLALPATMKSPDDPDEMALIGRLKPGVSTENAQAEMDVLSRRFEAANPRAAGWYRSRVTPLARQVVGDTRRPLSILSATVAIVLLIACANVAGLLLTRSVGRRREFTLRAALGAGRAHLIRQLLTESMLLAVLGGAIGIGVTQAAISTVKAFGPSTIPRLREISFDPMVLLFAVLATLGAGMLFGLTPALGTLGDIAESLKSGSPKGGSQANSRMRSATLVGEIALALVLTIAAGLFVRTFYRLLSVDGGFNPEHVLTFELSLSEAKYGNNKDRMAGFYHAVLEKLKDVRGMEAVGIGEVVPLGGAGESTGIRLPGAPPVRKGERRYANFTIVSPDYFAAIGTPVLRGRPILESDTAESAPVTLINRAMAQKYWPNEDPIGKQVGPGSARYPASVIVGIVADVKHFSLRDEPAPEMYVPYTQRPWPSMLSMQVAMRVKGDAPSAISAARAALHSLDPDLPVGTVTTLASLIDDSMTQTRFSMLLIAGFGLLAVVLTSIGMYGVVSYSVAQRTREIGIRIALGARPRDVFGMVLGEGVKLVVLGIALGIAGALASTRLIQSQLYGVEASDLLTFASASLLLLVIAMAACYVPARRAVRVEPTVALRSE
jgi:putative ABC transport system permease protein